MSGTAFIGAVFAIAFIEGDCAGIIPPGPLDGPIPMGPFGVVGTPLAIGAPPCAAIPGGRAPPCCGPLENDDGG